MDAEKRYPPHTRGRAEAGEELADPGLPVLAAQDVGRGIADRAQHGAQTRRQCAGRLVGAYTGFVGPRHRGTAPSASPAHGPVASGRAVSPAPRSLTADWDLIPSDPAWTPDGRALRRYVLLMRN